MGDYTKNGTKIGTCGKAYYSTYKALKQHPDALDASSDVAMYLKKENGCSFAFPFPEFKGKKVGEISQFHKKPEDKFWVTMDDGNKYSLEYLGYYQGKPSLLIYDDKRNGFHQFETVDVMEVLNGIVANEKHDCEYKMEMIKEIKDWLLQK